VATDGEDRIMSGLNSQLDPLMALVLRACPYNHLEIFILALVCKVNN